jgi:hypothetical protein
MPPARQLRNNRPQPDAFVRRGDRRQRDPRIRHDKDRLPPAHVIPHEHLVPAGLLPLRQPGDDASASSSKIGRNRPERIGIMARLSQSGWGVCPMIAQDGTVVTCPRYAGCRTAIPARNSMMLSRSQSPSITAELRAVILSNVVTLCNQICRRACLSGRTAWRSVGSRVRPWRAGSASFAWSAPTYLIAARSGCRENLKSARTKPCACPP